MLGSLRELARTLLAFAETRARLAAADIEEQAVRFIEIALLAALALFFFIVGIVFVSIIALLALWDADRLLGASILGGLYFVAGAVAATLMRKRLRDRPPFLAATLEELRKDRERLEAKSS